MNFCENCNFMLYKRLKSDGEECNTISLNSKSCQLEEYCKQCGFVKEIDEDCTSVYKRNYANTFAIDKILQNKYIVYDNTLPRISMDCKNKECITHSSIISPQNSRIIENIEENSSDEDLFSIFSGFNFGDETIESGNTNGYIKTINNVQIYFKRLRLCKVIIYLVGEDLTDEISDEIFSGLNEYLQQYSVDRDLIESLEIKPYTPVEKEVLYIKYDPDNMKYLYMCVNCGISW